MEDFQKSEKKGAKNFGRLTPGSGSGSSKLDIIGEGPFDGLRIENKFTSLRSRSIKLDELVKAFKQAMGHLNEYALRLDFQLKYVYIICSESYFIGIHEELDRLREENERLKAGI